ncbi:MAG: DUF6513 domain-containing protein [Methylococcales bacterium]|nr:DUF6513 domain-containing protein [Methylococcales bacterium]
MAEREHILFLTGKLAEPQLRQVLDAMQPEFDYTVHVLGVKVAALMTADMIARRLKDTFDADRILVPGRCRGDLDRLAEMFGIPVQRGPDELKDLPLFFGKAGQKPDLSQYRVRIFAEIVDAPRMDIPAIIARADYYRTQGADVIDLGCLPETPFSHLAEAVQELKRQGFQVSVDSLVTEDLRTGGLAGADYLLSLNEDSLFLLDEVPATPILIAKEHGDLTSLARAIKYLQQQGRPFLADPILDPIHFGFTESIVRYWQLRQDFPDIDIMMGVGNLTELTHADTAGMNALLFGIGSELDIAAVLATEVSQHACKAIKEADIARRIMYAAKRELRLPKHINAGLMTVHDTAPFPYQAEEIQTLAQQIKDPSYRIQTSPAGIHLYNRDGHHLADDPFTLYPNLNVDGDAGHAFYLGVELARAQIAWQLGKRFNQDEMLDWGVAFSNPDAEIDRHDFKPKGSTFA